MENSLILVIIILPLIGAALNGTVAVTNANRKKEIWGEKIAGMIAFGAVGIVSCVQALAELRAERLAFDNDALDRAGEDGARHLEAELDHLECLRREA